MRKYTKEEKKSQTISMHALEVWRGNKKWFDAAGKPLNCTECQKIYKKVYGHIKTYLYHH
jgi:hypothetical protein